MPPSESETLYFPTEDGGCGGGCAGSAEIEEIDDDGPMPEPRHLPAVPEGQEDLDVYVVVGKESSSMNALSWALEHAVGPTSFVYLVHVFPEVHHIPTPLGMLPKGRVNPHRLESHMMQVRSEKTKLLHKFMNLCISSKVKVDAVLIESDQDVKAIVELIPVLQIRKLIIGTSKSRRLRKSGGGKAEQIKKAAPDYCEINIICDGKEVVPATDSTVSTPLPSPSKQKTNNKTKEINGQLEDGKDRDLFSCPCFSGKFS